jgi:hypothetical protein
MAAILHFGRDKPCLRMDGCIFELCEGLSLV